MPPTTPGRRVIATVGDRLVSGEIIATKPAPRFGALDRTRLTIRTEPHGTEITALARDVEVADPDDGLGALTPSLSSDDIPELAGTQL